MANITHDLAAQRAALSRAQVIAVVGHSDKPNRTSYQIANYLRRVGYKVYPVNPTVTTIDGEKSYPNLAAIPEKIDIVNVFRRSEHLPGIVVAANAVGAKTIWTQLGVRDDQAAQAATDAGLDIVMDRCIKVEHRRLMG
jgi:hypothetical protein